MKPDPSSHAFPAYPWRARFPNSIDTLRENEYLNALDVPIIEKLALQRIQSVYRVRVPQWPQVGYGYRMMLIWDHNRLWGSFELGSFEGIMVIDPGPSKDVPMAYSFRWRGTSTKTPNTVFNSAWTTGEILLGATGRLKGHFDAMLGVGLPYGRCDFTAKCEMGPAVVPRALHSFVEEWNRLATSNEREAIRSPPSSDDSSSKESLLSSRTCSEDSSEWTAETHCHFLGYVSGMFSITSTTIAQNWPSKTRWLTIRFHVDLELGKVWGKFDMGVCEGFLVLKNSPESVEPGIPLQFQWRGSDVDGDRMSGKGEVTIMADHCIREGVFHDMWGDVHFEGRRRAMPAWVSGYEGWYYREQWKKLV
jgi:hypothetical protein